MLRSVSGLFPLNASGICSLMTTKNVVQMFPRGPEPAFEDHCDRVFIMKTVRWAFEPSRERGLPDQLH